MKKFTEQPPLFPESGKETPLSETPAAQKEVSAYSHPSKQDYAELTGTLGEKELSPGNETTEAKKVPEKVKKALAEIDETFLLPKKQIHLKKEKKS